MNALLTIPLVVIGLAVIAAVYQWLASRRDQRHFPPPGQLVDIGGHRLHLAVMGEENGGPTVILEAGMASISSNWGWVQPDVAKVTRVVAYDRAGLGWSDLVTQPRDAAKSAKELHLALETAGIEGPYVLAGHSYGGLVTRMFADLYPDDVVGLVLVDASHPDQWLHIPASKGGQTVAIGNRITALLARFGILRLFHLEEAFINGLPPQQYGEMKAYLATPNGWLAGAEGLTAWRDLSRQQVNATRPLGSLPLFVLSVTEQDRYAEVLTQLQAELPSLSSNSKHVTIEGATHYSLVSKQEYATAVVDAILQVLDAARNGTPLSPPTMRRENEPRQYETVASARLENGASE